MAKDTLKTRAGKAPAASAPRANRDERYAAGRALRDRVARSSVANGNRPETGTIPSTW